MSFQLLLHRKDVNICLRRDS